MATKKSKNNKKKSTYCWYVFKMNSEGRWRENEERERRKKRTRRDENVTKSVLELLWSRLFSFHYFSPGINCQIIKVALLISLKFLMRQILRKKNVVMYQETKEKEVLPHERSWIKEGKGENSLFLPLSSFILFSPKFGIIERQKQVGKGIWESKERILSSLKTWGVVIIILIWYEYW